MRELLQRKANPLKGNPGVRRLLPGPGLAHQKKDLHHLVKGHLNQDLQQKLVQ
jgi:hypothetical protein